MKINITIIFLFFMSTVMAQEKGAIQGMVLDNEMNQDPFAFVSVSIKELKTNISTDLYGTFYMDAEPGIYTLEFKTAGYHKVEIPNISIQTGKVTNLKNVLMNVLQVPQISGEVRKTELKRETTTSLHIN